MSGLAAVPLWPWLALVFSFCGAVIIGYNQWARVDGRKLVVLRSVGVWPLAAAGALFLPWPGNWEFYAAAAGMGMGLAYADTLLFNAAAAHGGRLTALYVPMKMLTGFALWALLAPESLLPLLVEPWRLGVLTAGFGLCSGALIFLRQADASWAALAAVLPVAMLFALGDVVVKEALEPAGGMDLWTVAGHAVAFLFTTTTVGSVGGMVGGAVRVTRAEVAKGAVFGVILLCGLTLLLVTIALAPNPGYVAAITMLSALWLAIWGWWQRGERNNWWAGVALVAGALAVALATAG